MLTRLCLLAQASLVKVLVVVQQVTKRNPILQIAQVVQMKELKMHLIQVF